ncbi:MAG: HDOD domain-containing protein [Methylococcaceae bacterium]|nr:HDOD domain-containing protein [Methylococcaceae bacterium]
MRTPEQLIAQTTELVTLPEIYWQLRGLMESPDVTVSEFAGVIRLDPGLSAKLLQISNSAFYGLSRQVETINYAVNILGTSLIHDLVLATSVTRCFAGISSEIENLGKFWRRSVYCGLAARALAERAQLLDGERVFTAGMLHDVGHLVLCLREPEPLRLALAMSTTQRRPLDEVQRDSWGYDAGMVGKRLMAAWRLPVSLQEAAGYHRRPGQALEFRLETAVVHVAWRLAMQMEKGDDFEAFAPFDPAVAEVLMYGEPDLQAARAAAAELLPDTLALFVR